MFRFILATLAAFIVTPAFAWSDVNSMNRFIDQTNFIVGRGCSGTLIDVENRLILTNDHCITKFVGTTVREIVENGAVIKKEVPNNRDVIVGQRSYTNHRMVSSASYNATIVYRDPSIDLALLQFRADTIPHQIEASIFMGEVLRGQVVFVVGNPLGLDASVTKGIISSTNRYLKVGANEKPYLQVDAGITGGNSGGSLYNDSGELIGVPAAAARGTAIGLAIPVFFIKQFLVDACWASVFDDTAKTQEECAAPE